MSTITYRPYEPRDAEGVMATILDAFPARNFAPRPYLERSAAEVFLAECLLASTYARVAVATVDAAQGDDGEKAATERVMGVIMGRVEDELPLPGRPITQSQELMGAAWLATVGMPQRGTLMQALDLKRRYTELCQDVLGTGAAALTDEVTLLAVHSACRGRGIGGHLYDGFMDHLRDHGRTDFFLRADSLCDYEFYEGRGMVRAATREQRLDVPGLPKRVGVYLFAGQVPQATPAFT